MNDCAARPIRVFLRFNANDVPGNPQRRHMTLSERFFSADLGRYFNNEIDWIHVPANIDEPDAKCWMILDLNAVENVARVDQLPIRVFRVKYSDTTPYVHLLLLTGIN